MQYLTVFKNSSYQTFARILTSGKGFLIAVILARTFGSGGYGDFIKITSFVSLFYLFCDFGINAIFLKAKDSENSFKSLLYLRLIISFFAFFAANALSFILPYNQILGIGFSVFVKIGILIYSLELFIQAILFSTNAIFQKKLRYDFLTKSSAVGSVFSLIIVFLIATFNQSLYWVVAGIIIADSISAALSLFYAKENLFPITLDITFSKNLLKSSFPLGMMLVFNLIYFRIDSLILALFHSSRAVGIYGISFLFFDFLIALPLFISNSIYPILLKEKENKKPFLKLIKNYFFIYLGFSFMVAIPFWFASPLFTFIKPDFSLAIIPFRILILGLPFFFLTSFLQWILITFGKTGFLVKIYFASMCANIVLNLIFIPQYSYVAAALITGICEAFVFLFLFYKVVYIKYE